MISCTSQISKPNTVTVSLPATLQRPETKRLMEAPVGVCAHRAGVERGFINDKARS